MMKPDETGKSDGLMAEDMENGFLQAQYNINSTAPPSPEIQMRPLTADTKNEGGEN